MIHHLLRQSSGCALRNFVAALALVLSSCGGGGGDAPATQVATPPCGGGSTTSSSGTVTIVWDQLTVANLSGYRLYYGTAPGTYLQPKGQGLDAGNITAYTISGLNRGARYFFAVTAYDAADVESPFSNEVCKDVA